MWLAAICHARGWCSRLEMNMLCCTLAQPAFLSRRRAPLACMAVLPQHLHPCPAHVAAPPSLRLELLPCCHPQVRPLWARETWLPRERASMSRTTSIEWWLQPTGFGLLVLLQSTRPPPLFRISMCSQKSALLTVALSLCCTVTEAVTLMNLRQAIGVRHQEVGNVINALRARREQRKAH